ncbi:hypothetical protein BD779DRAFT_1788645 [Infundibulicybe gibba]|nr:hypothetical protein BD779DRAFT_1788645 [Infundibulicybe gibba]
MAQMDLLWAIIVRGMTLASKVIYSTIEPNKNHKESGCGLGVLGNPYITLPWEASIIHDCHIMPCYKYRSATASNLDLDSSPQVLNTSPTQGGQAKLSSPRPLDGSGPLHGDDMVLGVGGITRGIYRAVTVPSISYLEYNNNSAISVTFLKVVIWIATSTIRYTPDRLPKQSPKLYTACSSHHVRGGTSLFHLHTISVPPIFDFSATPLAKDYAGFYIKVIDDVFTPQECADLIVLAESDSKWEQAAVHYGLGPEQKYVNTEYRNSERILRFDHQAAEKMFQRLLPMVPELVQVKLHDRPLGDYVRCPWGSDWDVEASRVGLSFLRYGLGNYFRAHCDGQVELPDGRKLRVTLQVYLNNEGLSRGAQRGGGHDWAKICN